MGGWTVWPSAIICPNHEAIRSILYTIDGWTDRQVKEGILSQRSPASKDLGSNPRASSCNILYQDVSGHFIHDNNWSTKWALSCKALPGTLGAMLSYSWFSCCLLTCMLVTFYKINLGKKRFILAYGSRGSENMTA